MEILHPRADGKKYFSFPFLFEQGWLQFSLPDLIRLFSSSSSKIVTYRNGNNFPLPGQTLVYSYFLRILPLVRDRDDFRKCGFLHGKQDPVQQCSERGSLSISRASQAVGAKARSSIQSPPSLTSPFGQPQPSSSGRGAKRAILVCAGSVFLPG